MARKNAPESWGDMAQLRVAVEGLLAAKQMRVGAVNRAERGGIADAVQQERIIGPARELEKSYGRQLIETYRATVPAMVQDWAAGIPGLASGELFPSIIGLIGNPRVAQPYHWETDKPGSKNARDLVAGEPYDRTLPQFLAWCGIGDPYRRPGLMAQPGETLTQEQRLSMGKRNTLRPRLYTFTEIVQKGKGNENIASSKYGILLAKSKEAGLAKVHTVECRNRNRPPLGSNGCGIVAHPEWGAVGSPWRKGHAQAHAFRVVQRQFLADLFDVAGRI